MKLSRIGSKLFIFMILLAPMRPVWALQADDAPKPQEHSTAAQAGEKEGGESTEDSFRHSAAVASFGKMLGLDTETASRVFEYLNFAILAGVILYFVGKNLPGVFRGNREKIQRQLVEARTATEQANQRLAAIEQRLGHLDQEIAAISKQADQDSKEDEARIKASIESERKRIVDAVTRDIAAAGSAAQRDLKRFAAGLAVDRAAQRIVLTEDDDRSLMQEFASSLSRQAQNRNKN